MVNNIFQDLCLGFLSKQVDDKKKLDEICTLLNMLQNEWHEELFKELSLKFTSCIQLSSSVCKELSSMVERQLRPR